MVQAFMVQAFMVQAFMVQAFMVQAFMVQAFMVQAMRCCSIWKGMAARKRLAARRCWARSI
jgi:hypothetical protein